MNSLAFKVNTISAQSLRIVASCLAVQENGLKMKIWYG